MNTKYKLLLIIFSCKVFANNIDPYEKMNRGVFYFNRVFDGLYVKPTARAYDRHLPMTVRSSIGNFTDNIREIPSFVNCALQVKSDKVKNSFIRFVINSTLGFFGAFDIAAELGYKKHYEDFGQTLAHWGWEKSSYFMIPFLGPSTVRDAVGLVGNFFITPSNYLETSWRNTYTAVNIVHIRSNQKDVETVVGAAGIDYYTLVRSGFLQNRKFAINDGVPQEVSEDGVDFLGEPPE